MTTAAENGNKHVEQAGRRLADRVSQAWSINTTFACRHTLTATPHVNAQSTVGCRALSSPDCNVDGRRRDGRRMEATATKQRVRDQELALRGQADQHAGQQPAAQEADQRPLC